MFETIHNMKNRFDTETEPTRRRDGFVVQVDEDGMTATLANLVGGVITPLALAPATLLTVVGWRR